MTCRYAGPFAGGAVSVVGSDVACSGAPDPVLRVLMTKFLPHLMGLVLLVGGPAQPVRSQTSDSQIDPDLFFVLGNLEFILLHEVAHVLIGDLDIPVIGSEESAADYIATATLIGADLFDATRAERALQFLLATANGLATSWDFSANLGTEIRYWDSHSLTIQRFYQMICLIYGSNQAQFAQLPERVGMPEARAARCPAEFERADRSLQWMLENFGRQSDDPPGAEIELVFEREPSQVAQRVMAAVNESGMLQNTVRLLRERFTLETPFRIAFRACRQPQAMWYPEAREIAICYALIDSYYSLGLTRSASRRQQELDTP